MAKPWARIEQNYINHAKFLALNANAICLWHEAKNYCDMQLNDGMFPRAALKTFRFNGAKAVEMLTRSCGLKPNGEPFSALWEHVDIGGVPHIRMHDYLDHNDCREKVQARMRAVEEERERDRQRKAAARAAKESKRNPEHVRPESGRTSGGLPAEIRSSTEAEAVSAAVSRVPSEPKRRGGNERPLIKNTRFAIFRWMIDQLIADLGPHVEGFDLDEWLYNQVPLIADAERGIVDDWWAWLRFKTLEEARRRGAPIAQTAPALGKANTRLAQALANIKAEAS